MAELNPGSGLLSFIPKPRLDAAAGERIVWEWLRPVEPLLLRYTKMAPWDLNGICFKGVFVVSVGLCKFVWKQLLERKRKLKCFILCIPEIGCPYYH